MIGLRSPRERRLTRLLGLLCLALCGVIAVELTAGPTVGPAGPPAGRGAAARGPRDDAGFSLPPAGAYAEIVARPLFSDTRRASAFSTAEADAHPNFVLVGTVLSTQARDALIKHGQPARVDHVAEGQSIDGWTVDSIQPDRVIFANADARLEVKAKDGPVVATQPRGGRTERETARVQKQPSSNLSSVPAPLTKE